MAMAPEGKRMTKAREARTPCAISMVRFFEGLTEAPELMVWTEFPPVAPPLGRVSQ